MPEGEWAAPRRGRRRPTAAVGVEDIVVSGEIDSGSGHHGGQPADSAAEGFWSEAPPGSQWVRFATEASVSGRVAQTEKWRAISITDTTNPSSNAIHPVIHRFESG